MASTSAQKPLQQDGASFGRSANGASVSPCTAPVVSHATHTEHPNAASTSRWGWIAVFSSSTDRSSSFNECHPDT